MNELSDPWDHHPDLTSIRLRSIASTIFQTRNETMTLDGVEPQNTPWGSGCLAYDRTRWAIIEQAKIEDWLSIVDGGMGFIFAVGKVPVRFYKGEPDEPTQRTLARRHPELQQQSMAFAKNPGDVIWRFAVESAVDGKVIAISFVGLDLNGDVISRWDFDRSKVIPISSAQKTPSKGRVLPPPSIGPKTDEEDNGVSSEKAETDPAR